MERKLSPTTQVGFRRLRTFAFSLLSVSAATAAITYAGPAGYVTMGRQPDGSFIVSSAQRVEPGAIVVNGRPIDLSLNPTGEFAAVLDQHGVMLVSPERVLQGSHVWLRHPAGFRGIAWHPGGSRLYVSSSAGYIQQIDVNGYRLRLGASISVRPPGSRGNPRPGGMAVTRDGSRLFVAVIDRNAVAEIDLANNRWVREYPVQNLPFEVQLSEDEGTLVVSNWGGRLAENDDARGASGNAVIVVDPRGSASSGTVSLVRRGTGETHRIKVGLHPTALAISGSRAFVTNSASDSVTEIDLATRTAVRTIPIRWGRMNLFGSMPCAISVRNGKAYVCNGGDNAVCVVDLGTGRVLGFLPAGYYPIAIALQKSGSKAFVLNTKGNGSVRRTTNGIPGNAHEFQGTVSVIDLNANLAVATARVASDNGWNRDRTTLRPNLAVYNGAIEHVIYIIKENRTYDEVLGDMKQGNGDPSLCYLGEHITPNHHAVARQFTLFDNAYVSGTNSADGHQWCTQALSNDYMEHFYTGYRTYSFDGSCAMSISSAGCLWDAALKKGRTIRDYGEFCDTRLATFTPKVKSWSEVWRDRVTGKNAIRIRSGTRIPSLRPYTHPQVLCWPLLQSDQSRADIFISDYTRMSLSDKVPNLMFLSLPCDHTEGRNPNYPRPECMVADNDLALGRIVEAVSRSPQWKSTCIFVIEDDAQFGLDHVDGHRTVCFALSPYTKHAFVTHEMCNTVSIIRSIELMLGIGPMNRFDALTPPLRDCFTDSPNTSPYKAVPNRVALDTMNAPIGALTGKELYWTQRSIALDWSAPDRADARVLNQVMWHTACGVNSLYPDL